MSSFPSIFFLFLVRPFASAMIRQRYGRLSYRLDLGDVWPCFCRKQDWSFYFRSTFITAWTRALPRSSPPEAKPREKHYCPYDSTAASSLPHCHAGSAAAATSVAAATALQSSERRQPQHLSTALHRPAYSMSCASARYRSRFSYKSWSPGSTFTFEVDDPRIKTKTTLHNF